MLTLKNHFDGVSCAVKYEMAFILSDAEPCGGIG